MAIFNPPSSVGPAAVGGSLIAQWFVATGRGTIRLARVPFIMVQCLLLHGAEIVRAALMAAFARARTTTQTVVVIHRLSRKTGRALVAGVAVHA